MQDLVGKIVKVSSYRGGPRDRICEVKEVRDTWKKYPFLKSRMKRLITRSRWLITLYDIVRKEYRSYYHEFAEIDKLSMSEEIVFRCQLKGAR